MNNSFKTILYFSCLTLFSSAHASNILITNSGAESGNLSGWVSTNPDYSAINNPGDANSGSYYFGLNSGVIPDSAYDLIGSNYYKALTSTAIDLSPYSGILKNIHVSGSAITNNFSLSLELASGASYDYDLAAAVSINLLDIDDNYITGYGASAINGLNWHELSQDLSDYADWDINKNNISSVEIGFDVSIFSFSPGAPQLADINQNDVVSASYHWEDNNGSYSTDDLSSITASPLIGFDDARLEVTTVPLPGAIWLLGFAITFLRFFKQKNI